MARGRSVSGRRKSPASWATASHPTKSHTRMVAAVPTAHHPCGANGVQLSPALDGSATTIATAITTISTEESANWRPDEMCRPNTFAINTVANMVSPTVGAPRSTAVRNHTPVTAAAASPRPSRTYADTPPATGWRTPSAAKVIASGPDSTSNAPHAMIDAAPAARAASAGTRRTPGPISAPTYNALPRGTPRPSTIRSSASRPQPSLEQTHPCGPVARGIGSSQQVNHWNAGTGLQDLALVCQAHAVPPGSRQFGHELSGGVAYAGEYDREFAEARLAEIRTPLDAAPLSWWSWAPGCDQSRGRAERVVVTRR